MRRKRRRFHPAFWLLAAVLAVLTLGYGLAEENLRPAATAMAEHRTRLTAEAAMNDGVEAVLAALEDAPLVEVVQNGDGEVQAVEVRMQAVNRVKLRITEQILRNLRQAGDSGKMKIPLGSLLGSGLLAGKGPGLTYRFLPGGSVSTRILSRFEACGVNQTRHQLLLSVEVRGVCHPFPVPGGGGGPHGVCPGGDCGGGNRSGKLHPGPHRGFGPCPGDQRLSGGNPALTRRSFCIIIDSIVCRTPTDLDER